MSLETVMEQLAKYTHAFMTATIFHLEAKMNFKNQAASIHNLEVQIGKIASMLSARTQGSLPSNTKKNPKEQVHAITLRSGKQLEQIQKPSTGIIHQKDIGEAKKHQGNTSSSRAKKSVAQPTIRLASREKDKSEKPPNTTEKPLIKHTFTHCRFLKGSNRTK